MADKFAKMHDAFASADSNLSLTPQGSGGYDLHPETLVPTKKKHGMKPQSAAQHMAVEKAGKSSAQKRKIAAGLPLVSQPKVL
jgi:hypothetical protein